VKPRFTHKRLRTYGTGYHLKVDATPSIWGHQVRRRDIRKKTTDDSFFAYLDEISIVGECNIQDLPYLRALFETARLIRAETV
jgi:hypothetical protein